MTQIINFIIGIFNKVKSIFPYVTGFLLGVVTQKEKEKRKKAEAKILKLSKSYENIKSLKKKYNDLRDSPDVHSIELPKED